MFEEQILLLQQKLKPKTNYLNKLKQSSIPKFFYSKLKLILNLEKNYVIHNKKFKKDINNDEKNIMYNNVSVNNISQ